MVLLLAHSGDEQDSSCTENQLTLRALTNRSLLYLQRGDHDSALSDLLWAAELSPHDKTIYHTLGICYHKLVLNIFYFSFLSFLILLLISMSVLVIIFFTVDNNIIININTNIIINGDGGGVSGVGGSGQAC